MCAILHCCKKARVSIRSPLRCSSSSRQGFAAAPTRRPQEAAAEAEGPAGAGQRPPQGGGKKYLREKFSNPTSDGKKKRREREKEDVGRCACVSACPSVRRREKCQLSHECPTSLPDGGQPLQPPVILATIRAEDKDIAHWNTTMSKVRKLLIFFT